MEDLMKFYVVLEPAEEGGFNASVPVLEGCFTQGDTEEEALENAREAIVCYLEGLEKLNEIKGRPGLNLREVEIPL
jgi:antitoxin HicB